MRHFLIFYSYSKLPKEEIMFAHFVLEASTFPDKPYVKKNVLEDMEKYNGGRNKFLGITGITEVHKAEVTSYE